MKSTMTSLLAAAAIAGTLAATATDANAQFRRWGPALGLGIVGGLAIGSILATRPPGYVYYDYGQPLYASNCYWARKRIRDASGTVYWSEPIQVCPGYRGPY